MNWFHKQLGDAYFIAKRFPLSFDLLAETNFPVCRPKILALQIRQDMRRLLQNLRGFLPAVEVRVSVFCMHVRAGGQLTCSVHVQSAQFKLQNMLDDPVYRKRWKDYATLRRGASRRSVLL